MPGPRQPTDVVKAKGRKHLSKAEEAQRRAGEVQVERPKTVKVPKWVPEDLKKEFRALGRKLLAAGLYTDLDADTLGRYLVAQRQYILATQETEWPWTSGTRKWRTAGARSKSGILSRPGTAPTTWA